MAGIYLHIPFCKTRCSYCDFYSTVNQSVADDFVATLCLEIERRATELQGEVIETVYFGGGTPSQLHPTHFEQIFKALFSVYDIEPGAEITIEANPDDLSRNYLSQLRSLFVNRLSIGIQSFDETELVSLNRRHTVRQAVDAVNNAQALGFDNISIDLMYGLPSQTLRLWRKNLNRACRLGVQHISAYHLIYEEKTKLTRLLRKGKIDAVPEETGNRMFSMLMETLALAGFEHYEISNFAKNQLYSRHNTAYWQNRKYLGFGPAAHSYDGNSRSWNVSSVAQYVRKIRENRLNRRFEVLSVSEKYNEFILTGLRTKWGVNLIELGSKFGNEYQTYCLKMARPFIKNRLLKMEDDILKLTRDGIFISDGVMSELMWVD